MTIAGSAVAPTHATAAWKIRMMAVAIDAALLALLLLAGDWLLSLPVADALPVSAAKPMGWLLTSLLVLGFWKAWGATPGKMVFSAKIVDAKTGGPLGLVQSLIRWIGLLISAVPLGAGLHWAAADPRGQALHDKWAGTLVVVDPAEEDGDVAAPRSLAQWLVQHWRGELPLASCLCLNTLLLLFPLAMALVWLSLQVNVVGEHLQIGSLLLLLLWPVTLAALVWGVVGSWRAVGRRIDVGLDLRAALGLRLLLMVVFGFLLWAALLDFAPKLGGYLTLAKGVDPKGNATLSASPDGHRLALSGTIGRGDGARFLALASQYPQARTLEIESSSGRVFEAQRIAQTAHDQGWRVRVVGDCEGPCTLVFLAGAQRLVMPNASLGLHRLAAGIWEPLTRNSAHRALMQPFAALGAPPVWIQKMLATPPDARWHPDRRFLYEEGLIEKSATGLDIKLPADPAHRSAAELLELLRDNPAWYALDLRYPGTLDEAVARMLMATGANAEADDGAMLAQGQSVYLDLLPRLLQETSNEQRMRYLSVWKQQLLNARSQSPAQCVNLLKGSAPAWRGQPEELAVFEAAWIVDAVQPGEMQLARPINAVELEVLRHELGDSAPELISGLMVRARSRDGRPDCERALKVLDALAAMPRSTRPVAARALFQN